MPRHVVVLLPTATRNEPAPTLTRPAQALLERAAQAGDATALVLSGGNAQTIDLTPRRAGGREDFGPRRQRLIADNVRRVGTVLLTAPPVQREELDLLAPLSAVHRLQPIPGTLIVLSSGVSTAGTLDLRRLTWQADPAEVATELERRGVLPDLHGWTVLFVGLGDVAGRQPPLHEMQRRALTGYWISICRAAGARDCRVDNTPRSVAPARSTGIVSRVDVEPTVSIDGPHRTAQYRLPSQFLFARDSAALSPDADALLRDIVVLTTSGACTVTVLGHTDASTGSPEHNLRLSQQRAGAVLDRLVSLGMPRTAAGRVTGLGSAGTSAAQEQTDGLPDAAKTAAQRYVRIHVTSSTPLSS